MQMCAELKLPEFMSAGVLEATPAAEQSAPPQSGSWRGCKDSAAVRLVCSGWQAMHDALVMKLVLTRQTTDEGVGMLARRFPAVASLELKPKYGVSALTDKGLRAVSNLPALTSLNIGFCEEVTDVGMRAVSSLPALTSLDIEGCMKVTDEGMRAVSHLPALKSLNLTYCHLLTDETLRALSSCNTLASLNLTECKMTDEGMRAVSSLPALTFLDLWGCGYVTAAGVQALRNTTAAPNLVINWEEEDEREY
jgi:hypothetical protein